MPKRSSTRVTKTTVDAMSPGQTIWDADLKGFGVRCQRKAKVYYVKYGSDWHKLGEHGHLTPDVARKEAQALIGRLREGYLPKAKVTVTVAELAERYMREHARPHKKPRSVIVDEGLL